jgi:hypothetical protein
MTLFLIVHGPTETILNAHECFMVDIDSLDDHDSAVLASLDDDEYLDNAVVVEIVTRCGRAVVG